MAYTTFLLMEILAVDASQHSVSECCLTLESIFTEICESLRIKPEVQSPTPPYAANCGSSLAAYDGDTFCIAPTTRISDTLLANETSNQGDDLDWFFNDGNQSADAPPAAAISSADNKCNYMYRNERNNSYNCDDSKCMPNDNSDNSSTSTTSGSNGSSICDRKEDDSLSSYIRLPLFSDVWLAYGLQHCFQWEFEFNLNTKKYNTPTGNDSNRCSRDIRDSNNTIPNSSEKGINSKSLNHDENGPNVVEPGSLIDLDIALPMRLAIEAATTLWRQSLNNTNMNTNANTNTKEKILATHTAQFQEEYNENVDNNINNNGNYADDFLSSSSSSIHKYHRGRNEQNKNLKNPEKDEYDKSKFSFHTMNNMVDFNDRYKADNDNDYDYYSFLNELNLDDIVVHTVCGVPSKYSVCKPDTLISSCKKNLVGNSIDLVREKRSKSLVVDKKDALTTFYGIAIVDTGWETDQFDSGDIGEGAGASQQAKTIRHTHIKSPSFSFNMSNNHDNDNDSNKNNNNLNDNKVNNKENESSDSLYLKKSINLLKKLNISLLFCLKSFSSLKLIDACKSASIAIFPLSSIELKTISYLIDCEIVGDILDLEPDSRGNCINVLIFPFLSVRSDEKIKKEMKNSGKRGHDSGARQGKKENISINESDNDEIFIGFSKVFQSVRTGKKKKEKNNLDEIDDLYSGGRHQSTELQRNNISRDKNNFTSSQRSDIPSTMPSSSHPHSSCFSQSSPPSSSSSSPPPSASSASSASSCSSPSTPPQFNSLISSSIYNKNQSNTNIVSVIITAPTSAQAATLADRFYRCLHRLRGLIQGAGIMPGAGKEYYYCILHCFKISFSVFF